MRHRIGMSVLMMTLCLGLCACAPVGGGSEAEQLALEIRGEYLSMTECEAALDITADYGQRVYEYSAQLACTKDETVLTLTAPELVAGISAHIQAGETALEYDGMRVETGPLDETGLSPVDAVPALLEYIKGGFIAECGMEKTEEGDEQLRLVCREADGTAGEGRECSLWFDPDSHALLRGELSQDGAVIVRCQFTSFHFSVPQESTAP